jgi:hypothetical protein
VKQEQIEIGNVYAAKVTDKVVPVRIDAVCLSLSTGKPGGWDATNLKTNRKVRIKSAAKLRKQIAMPDAGADAAKPVTKQPVKKKLTAAERRARVAASNAKPNVDKAEPSKTPAKADKPAAKTADAPTEKRLSLIDAAVQVLGDSDAPLNCKQMVEQITAQGLWSPRSGGKTPHATLYSSILRELQKKGDEARFTKVERGQFTLAPGMKKGA